MADPTDNPEAYDLGTRLMRPVARKVMDAATVYAYQQNKQAIIDVYLGAAGWLAGVMAAHIGPQIATNILRQCIAAIEQKRQRSLN